jgi:serine/threonine protein kinase
MPGLEGKILDRYELRRLIGRGGMADVYEGYDPRFDRKVAVKVFKREDEEMLNRFIREARLMAKLNNKHLVPVYDSNQSQIDGVTWHYIVMPFMEGGTLRARIRRSPLPLKQACEYLRDIADALDYIHNQGIIHRDIKASNVLLDSEGSCYLSDFGIARITTDATQLTSTGNVLGTVDYVAPELFEVNRRADARSDLYSLGVLLFEMVTGQLPFSAENQLALVSMHMNKRPPSPRSISVVGRFIEPISNQVDRVILRALEKKPEQRYGSASELTEAFCRAVNKTRNVARPLGGLVGSGNASKRRPSESLVPLVPTAPTVLPAQADQQAPKPPVGPTVPLKSSPLAGSLETPPAVVGAPLAGPASGGGSRALGRGKSSIDDQATVPVSPPAQSRRRPLLIALLALVALLVISIPLFFVLMPRGKVTPGPQSTTTSQTSGTQTQQLSPTATPNMTATATAIAQAIATQTAVAKQNATATAAANATATAVAQVTATAGVLGTATSGTPDYQDTLMDANSSATVAAQWDQDNNCSFQSNGYHVQRNFSQLSLLNFQGCHEAAHAYKNVATTVDMDLLKGHSGGLAFRVNIGAFNSYNDYLFEVQSTGLYKISVQAGATLTTLQDWTTSSALKKGYNVKNTLQVIARDNTFNFYANGTFLVQLQDSTYTTEGNIALFATADETETNTEVVYSNLKVYPLS